MIYIVPDEGKSNFNAAVKYGDSNAASDILTDRLSKLLLNKRDDVITILIENGINPGNTTESIANALTSGLQKSEKVRKAIATLIAISEAKAHSNMTGEEAKLLSEQLNNPEIQNQLKNFTTSIFNLFGKGQSTTKITKDLVEKTKAQNQPAAKKNYTGYYVAGGILLTAGILIGSYYLFIKPGKEASA